MKIWIFMGFIFNCTYIYVFKTLMECKAVLTLQFKGITVKNYLFLTDERIREWARATFAMSRTLLN